MTQKYFPRGGKKYEDRGSSESQLSKKTSKKDREKRQQIANEESNESSTFVATIAERLSYTTIQEGMIVLGCINQATEYDLILSLPGGMLGRVQVTDISDSYTALLQSIIKSENTESDEFKPLPQLYSVGDQIVCYVKKIQPNEKWQIMLSIEPKLINENIDNNYLTKGSNIVCTISSVEDHGYVMDTGMLNVRAFISNKDVNIGKTYSPGKQLQCHIKEVQTSENTKIIKLSARQKLVRETNSSEVKSLDALMPGTNFMLRVKKILSNGLQVSFAEKAIGYINQLHLDRPFSSYSEGMDINGTLLYILPTIKFGYFSLMLKKPVVHTLKPGDIIGKATSLYRDANGIVLQLTDTGIRGFVPLKRIEIDISKISEKFVPGTKHKCRVLSYNQMDATYVCTMERALIEQKYFSLSDCKPGDTVKVRIKTINTNTGNITVTVGKLNGHIFPEHVSDSGINAAKKLQVGQEVEAKVMRIDTERNKINFTLKKSLITSDLPLLSDIREATYGSQHHGTVVQINKNGILIRFFGDVKGWVPRSSLNEDEAQVNWNYSIGQTVLAKIESVDQSSCKIKLSLPIKVEKKEVERYSNFVIGSSVEGTIIDSSIEGVHLKIRNVDGEGTIIGFLPTGHMAPCVEIANLLASKCMPGDTLSALVFATTPNLILSRTFVPQEGYRNFKKLQVGDIIPCSIRDVEPNGVRVILPIEGCTPFGYVPLKNVTNFKLLRTHQILFAKVQSINKKEKQLGLNMSLKKIYDGFSDNQSKMTAAVDVLTLHFNKLFELANTPFYKKRPISSLSLGQRVIGRIEKITTDGLVVQLNNDLVGVVRKGHHSGKQKVNDTVSGTIIWIDYAQELVDLTLLPTIMNSINTNQKASNLPIGVVLRAKILMVTTWFVLIVIKGQGNGFLAALPTRRHINDTQPDLSPYVVHSKLRCYMILNRGESDLTPICMLKSAFEMMKKTVKTKTKTSTKKDNLKRKKDTQEDDKESVKRLKIEGIEAVENSERHQEDLSGSMEIESASEYIKEEILDSERIDEEKPRISECGFFWDEKPDKSILEKEETSSDDEDEVVQPLKEKKKKLNNAERRELERQKEREIREREEALASNQLPNSVDQFDRLVLASPDSSLIWLQYMAYHLQATEIEKARAVARKAITTISFREEGEKLNVWNAWLNFESKFGTPESLNEVLQEAVRTNDSLKIYTHMLTVHLEAGRRTELEKIISTMTNKFKQYLQVWIECGTAFLKMGLKEKSRQVMQRALQSLPASQHVNLMVRFAILENKFGDKERSQTLFEQILSSYPKRVDVWSTYVDTLIKSGDNDNSRNVLERAIVQVLPARKMKTLFKKFINFEEQHGTAEGVARVQQLAAEYVEKQCAKNS